MPNGRARQTGRLGVKIGVCGIDFRPNPRTGIDLWEPGQSLIFFSKIFRPDPRFPGPGLSLKTVRSESRDRKLALLNLIKKNRDVQHIKISLSRSQDHDLYFYNSIYFKDTPYVPKTRNMVGTYFLISGLMGTPP